MRAQTNGSGRGTSGFPDAFAELFGKQGHGSLGQILASFGLPDLGEPIAKGKDAVLDAMKDHVEQVTGSPMSAEALHSFEHDIDDAGDNVTMYMVDGKPVIMAAVLNKGGLGMDELENAMRFSDRHGGKSAFDDFFGFVPKGGSRNAGDRLRDRLRAAMGKKDDGLRERTRPVKDFFSYLDSGKDTQTDVTSAPIAIDLALCSSVAATEIARYPRTPDDAALKAAAAFGQLVQDLEATYPAKFKNLAGYLEPYGVNVKNIAERARQFSRDPRSDVHETLARDLSLANVACINAMRDAKDRAKRLFDEATDI